MFEKQFLLLLFSVCLAYSQALTYKENQERLKKCGKHVPHPPSPSPGQEHILLPQGIYQDPFEPEPNSWLVRVQLLDHQGAVHPDFAMGSFISPRHVITVSQMIMNDDDEWLWNGEPLKPEDYLNGTLNVRVPLEKTNGFQIKVRVRVSDDEYKLYSVKKAWLLNFPPPEDYYEHRSTMLIELAENFDEIQYPCVRGQLTVTSLGDFVYIFGLGQYRMFDLVSPRFAKLTRVRPVWLQVDRYHYPLDRGGPMIVDEKGKVTVLAVASTPAMDVNYSFTYFFNLEFMLDDMCFHAGICDVPIIPQKPKKASLSVDQKPIASRQMATTPEPDSHYRTDISFALFLISVFVLSTL